MKMSAIPMDDRMQSVLATSHEYEVEDEGDAFLSAANGVIKSCITCDDDNICNLSYTGTVYYSNYPIIRLNFDEATKFFSVVRIRFVQVEYRQDGSCVQEKVMDTAVRHISHALSLHIKMRHPPNQSTTFVSPVVHVRYHLDVEFYPENDGVESIPPLSWQYPIEIISRPPTRSAKAERLACLEPSTILLQHEL